VVVIEREKALEVCNALVADATEIESIADRVKFNQTQVELKDVAQAIRSRVEKLHKLLGVR
jgi:hypothetical protein